MRKIKYTLALVFLLSSIALAQDRLINTKGDTLKGKIGFGLDNSKREFVLLTNGKKKQVVKIMAVRHILMENGDFIRPVRWGDSYGLGKELVSGYLTYFKVNDLKISEKFTHDLLYKADGTFVLFASNLSFKTRSKKFLKECDEVVEAIDNKVLRRRDLRKITQMYNECVQTKNQRSRVLVESPEPPKLSESMEQKLTDFATLLEKSDKISNKSDVTAMFNDVSGKLRRKEVVPGYLKTALINALKTDLQLTSLLTEILGD